MLPRTGWIESSGLQCLIDSAVRLQPSDITLFRMFGDILQQLHRLGLIARFARIILRNDRLNLDRNDEAVRSNQPRARHSFVHGNQYNTAKHPISSAA